MDIAMGAVTISGTIPKLRGIAEKVLNRPKNMSQLWDNAVQATDELNAVKPSIVFNHFNPYRGPEVFRDVGPTKAKKLPEDIDRFLNSIEPPPSKEIIQDAWDSGHTIPVFRGGSTKAKSIASSGNHYGGTHVGLDVRPAADFFYADTWRKMTGQRPETSPRITMSLARMNNPLATSDRGAQSVLSFRDMLEWGKLRQRDPAIQELWEQANAKDQGVLLRDFFADKNVDSLVYPNMLEGWGKHYPQSTKELLKVPSSLNMLYTGASHRRTGEFSMPSALIFDPENIKPISKFADGGIVSAGKKALNYAREKAGEVTKFPYIMKTAEDDARKYFPDEEHNGRGDALRHMMASGLVTQRYGRIPAALLGYGVEAFGDDPLEESFMDLFNNSLGRDLGSTFTTEEALRQGALNAIANQRTRQLSGAYKNYQSTRDKELPSPPKYANGGLVGNNPFTAQTKGLFGQMDLIHPLKDPNAEGFAEGGLVEDLIGGLTEEQAHDIMIALHTDEPKKFANGGLVGNNPFTSQTKGLFGQMDLIHPKNNGAMPLDIGSINDNNVLAQARANTPQAQHYTTR